MGISRVSRTHRQARENYDRLSRGYDLLAGSSEHRLSQAGLDLLAVQPGETVLELGCGTGWALAKLAQAAGTQGFVLGLDLSSGMLQQAVRRKAGRLVCADGLLLPLPAACLDVIFASFVLELFDTSEIPLLLEECRRVLRPGGRMGVVSLQTGPGVAVRLYERAHAAFPVLVDCRPVDAAADLLAAGFQLETHKLLKMWGLPVAVISANSP